MSRICVIGAGLVGCATAYELVQAGHQVQLLEANSGPGLGTSFANGAQLSYSYVEPLASPATLRALPAYLLARDSPLSFRPRWDLDQWTWIAGFLAACTDRRLQKGTAELLTLAQASRRKLASWQTRERLEFHHAQNGKLVLCPSDQSLSVQARQVDIQAKMGCKQVVLSHRECLDREPALGAGAEHFVGGIWTEDECVGDPFELCQELLRCFRRDGGIATFNTRVSAIPQRGNKALYLQTANGEVVQADHFVVCSGVQTPAFSASLGLEKPIYPIKGYSLTLPIKAAELAPKVNVTDLGRKTVFAPLGGQLRVAAKAELTGYGLEIPEEIVASMMLAVDRLFPGACGAPTGSAWAGLRPATPDSIPMIGRTRLTNVFVNAGHGALGFTLAAGSAERIAALIDGEGKRSRRVAKGRPSAACAIV